MRKQVGSLQSEPPVQRSICGLMVYDISSAAARWAARGQRHASPSALRARAAAGRSHGRSLRRVSAWAGLVGPCAGSRGRKRGGGVQRRGWACMPLPPRLCVGRDFPVVASVFPTLPLLCRVTRDHERRKKRRKTAIFRCWGEREERVPRALQSYHLPTQGVSQRKACEEGCRS